MSAAGLLAVVEVVSERPHAPEYERYASAMIDNVVRVARQLGWRVERLAAEDLGSEGLLAATAEASAIVICGGEDIDPSYYGAARGYDAEGRHYPRADAAQIAVVRRAAHRGTPVLGICRGHQIINIAFGGTLISHIESPGHRNEFLPVEYILTEHPVLLDPESRLAEAVGGHYVLAQSAHHQVIDRPGDGLRVVGWAHDGLPEAIEHESLPISGVQWHPEAPAAPEGQLAGLLAGVLIQDAAFGHALLAA